MASVQLHLRRRKAHRLGPQELCLEKAMILLRVVVPGKPSVLRDAVFDTGAPFSVFPQDTWTIFEPSIRWLSPLEEAALPPWLLGFQGATGGSFGGRIGTVTLELFDLLGGRLGPFDLTAMFAMDGGKMCDPLLGLSGGMMDRRVFELDYDAPSIQLRDA